MRKFLIIVASFLVLASCSSTGNRAKIVYVDRYAGASIDDSQRSQAFKKLPNWSKTDISAGYTAFLQSCVAFKKKKASSYLSRSAPWAGRVRDWQDVCKDMQKLSEDVDVKIAFEMLFEPVNMSDTSDGWSKFTGYYEPIVEVRKKRRGKFRYAIPGPPGDIVKKNGKIYQKRKKKKKLRLYPERKDIKPKVVIAFAKVEDFYFLQIQGSGRLKYKNGKMVRAVYHQYNGKPYVSMGKWLLDSGKIDADQGSMQGVKEWMRNASKKEVRRAMNINPRYVFFKKEPLGDPNLGPDGAQRVPLTPMGSMAVDLDYYPLGVPMFIETTVAAFGDSKWTALLIAQDTGGAINGQVRGDIFFGTGDEAGEIAGTMNSRGKKWVLLPRDVALRMEQG